MMYDIDVHNKLHIKNLLIFKRASKRKNVVDMSMLLDNNQYVEYSITFKQDVLTLWVAKRLKVLFNSYFIDSRTDIMVNGLVDVKHPVRVYLDLLRSHVNFKFRTVTLDQMVGRVHYYFTGKSSSKSKLNATWKTAISRQACPWITQQVDYAIQNKTPDIQRIMKIMRLGMFYMVVKNYLYAKRKKIYRRQKEVEKSQSLTDESQVSS